MADPSILAENMREQQKRQYSGTMSDGARKRMAKAITIMCQGCRSKWKMNPFTGQLQYHNLTFLTLTIHSPSRNVPAREAYEKMLAPFLRWLREKHNVRTYVWKAELQKRGQLHYHMTFPNMIHLQDVRDKWNSLQREAGYLDEYAKQHGHYNANSIDIVSTKNVKGLARYIVKELVKEIDARRLEISKELEENTNADPHEVDTIADFLLGEETRINGKVWDCSNNLSGKNYFCVPLTKQAIDKIDQFCADPETFYIEDDFYRLVVLDKHPPPWMCLLNDWERENFLQYVEEICYVRDPVPEIEPEEVPQADPESTYSWEQLKIFQEERWSMVGHYVNN